MNLQEFTTKAEKELAQAFPQSVGLASGEFLKNFLRSQLENLAKEMAEAVRVGEKGTQELFPDIPVKPTEELAIACIKKDGFNLAASEQDLKLKTFLGDIK